MKTLADLPSGLCCTCRWWKPDGVSSETTMDEELSIRSDDMTISHGDCRRHAPLKMNLDRCQPIERHPVDNKAVEMAAVFPETFGDDFCGDYEFGFCPYPEAKA